MKKILLFLFLFSLPIFSEASLQVSGYISLKYLGGYTYQATIVDYTVGDPQNSGFCDTTNANEDTIRLYWGDGTSALLYRSNGTGDSVCECRKVGTFIGTHTFPGLGTYHLYFNGIERIANIINMVNSITDGMTIFNTLTINTYTGDSSALPVITKNPICNYACPTNCYNFNVGASLSGNDSLSYMLGDCLCFGTIAPGYYIPPNATINPVTGELNWCNPTSDGLWQFSIRITTYNRMVIEGIPTQIPIDTEEVELEVTVETDCPTGINEITRTTGYSLYPNPSDGKFMLESNNEDKAGKTMVEIYDMLGQKIYTQVLNETENPINLSDNTSGIYLYRVFTITGDIVSQGKFIIQK